MANLISACPIKDGVLSENAPTQPWQAWLNTIGIKINNHATLTNDSLLINPDFHWSRTKGNTPTTTDGEFVEKWNVKANGMTFSITPTFYTNTTYSSYTGSDRYVNITINTVNSNEFIIYQTINKELSLFQNRKITISSFALNNVANSFKCKFYIGFDLTGGGTNTYSADGKSLTIANGENDIVSTLTCPKVSTDNQTNVVTIALKLYDLVNPVNFNLYYIKPEVSETKTDLYVNHILEKLIIDNP